MRRVQAAGDQRLIDAARAQRWDEVGAIANQVDVNERQPDGATALLWTAQWNHLPTAVLIRAGADVNAANAYGVTPLYFAATNGSAQMTELLLQAGADPNAALPTGETVLMTAARTGELATVQALLARGADVEARERDLGQTALMWALAERHVDVARLLIERGADVRVRSRSGFTPLLFAVRQGLPDGVTMLMAHGADVDEASADGMTLMMALIEATWNWWRSCSRRRIPTPPVWASRRCIGPRAPGRARPRATTVYESGPRSRA